MENREPVGIPTRRDRQALETRARLIETAMDLFARQGLDGTSIKDIARGAGVAPGLLYHYFTGKEELFWAIFEERQFLPHIQRELTGAEDKPACDVMRSVILAFDAFLWDNQTLLRLLLQALQTNPRVEAMWHQMMARETAPLRRFLEDRIRAGELRPHTVDVTLNTLMLSTVVLHLPGMFSGRADRAYLCEMVGNTLRGVTA